jgi:hypothetical protein
MGGVAYRIFRSEVAIGLAQLRINLVGTDHHVKPGCLKT